MLNMFPRLQRRPGSAVTLAQAGNPTGYSIPYDPLNPAVAVPPPPGPSALDQAPPNYGPGYGPPKPPPFDPAGTEALGFQGRPPHQFGTMPLSPGTPGPLPHGTPPFNPKYGAPPETGGDFDLSDTLSGFWEDLTSGEFGKYNPNKKSGEQLYMESITPGKRSDSGSDTPWMGLGLTPEEEAEAAAEAEASGAGGPGGGGYHVARPTYKPGESPLPDWGEMPDAPVFQGPDYTKANEYFEAAKPKPYEEDKWDATLQGLAGMAAGFSPEGTVGEILGRMAGPGLTAWAGAREDEEQQQKEAEAQLAQWNASMGTQAGHQAGTTAEVANQNTQAVYDNALAKRDALKEATVFAREEDRFLYQTALDQAELDLRAAAENRQATMDQWTMENTGGFKMEDDIYQGFTRGYIPGFEGDIQGFKTQVAQEETQRLQAAAEAGDANAKELIQRQTLDPAGWQKYVDGVAYSQFRQQLGQ